MNLEHLAVLKVRKYSEIDRTSPKVTETRLFVFFLTPTGQTWDNLNIIIMIVTNYSP